MNMYIVVDLETTGLSANENEIWSISCLPVIIDRSKKYIQKLDIFSEINKNVDSNKMSDALKTRLSFYDVVDKGKAGSEKELLEKFYMHIGSLMLKYNSVNNFMVGYNVSFDKDFIYTRGKLYSLNFDDIFKPQIIDIMQWFMLYSLMNKSEVNEYFSLKNAVGKLCNENEYIFHTSNDDVLATYKVMCTILEKYGNYKEVQ